MIIGFQLLMILEVIGETVRSIPQNYLINMIFELTILYLSMEVWLEYAFQCCIFLKFAYLCLTRAMKQRWMLALGSHQRCGMTV